MSPIRSGATVAYRYLTPLFFLACLVQIFLAGRGVFGIRSHADRNEKPGHFFEHQSSLDPHRSLGNILGLVALILLVLALVAWPARRSIIGWFALLFVLTFLVQRITAIPSHPWAAALHPVVGVLILGISGWLSHRLWHGAEARAKTSVPVSAD